MPLDGDLIPIIYPNDHYAKVLENPFGAPVFLEGEYYAAPNRFFVHWTMYHTFREFPLLLQHFFRPIDSVYASVAISKLLIQLFLLGLFILYSGMGKKVSSQNWIIGGFLTLPLFQNSGYYFNGMGIIDQSVTYTFFYALPLCVFLLYAYPFFFQKNWRWNWFKGTLWGLLSIILPLSGTLIPGIVLVGTVVLGFKSIAYLKLRRKRIDFYAIKKFCKNPQFVLGAVIVLMSIYSLYIGRSNIEGFSAELSVLERYRKMPEGMVELLFQKPGYPLFLLVLVVNAYLMYKLPGGQIYFKILKWFGLFAILYILLLPLGGYRDYRPLIIRRDTFMPVLFGLIILFTYSTTYLLNCFKGKRHWIYLGSVILVLGIFTIADISELSENDCERKCLEILATSESEVTRLPADCTVMNWTIRRDSQKSVNVAEMIYHWKITPSVRLFYQE
jgi:hypothetical protein